MVSRSFAGPGHCRLGLPQRNQCPDFLDASSSRVSGAALRRRGIKHKRSEPHRPQTNGKVERWMRTAKALGGR
jgi:hypothetical protein